MKYLVVIPARGGSKGIKDKNIKPLCGIPLINYTINAFQSVKEYDLEIVVSTDSEKIKGVVTEHYDNVLVIDRPAELATDTARTEPCLVHANNFMEENYGRKYDAVITAQITSPLRTPETIKKSIEMFEENFDKNDAVVSVCSADYKFWKNENGTIIPEIMHIKPRRQDREPVYYENGLIYITKTQSLIEANLVYGHKPSGIVTEDKESIDIDTPEDFEFAEMWVNFLNNK